MAIEWFQVDANIGEKPEILEVADRLDLEVGLVVGRVVLLWGWAQVNCTNGEARVSMRTLCRIAGGDAGFWSGVCDAGWLVWDGDRIVIPKWDKRFSQSAKSRMLHARRSSESDSRRSSAGASGAQAPGLPAPERSRIEEIRNPPPPREASPGEAWERLRAAWNAGPGKAWTPPGPPDTIADRLAEPGWLDEALAAIPRLQGARYFRTPVTLLQFCGPGFVRRLAGGQYDEPKPAGPASPAGDRVSAEELARRHREKFDRKAAERRRREQAAEVVVQAVTDDGYDHAAAVAAAAAALKEAS